MEIYALLGFVLILSIYLGLELISKVPSTLHTPLMSGANAISGIALVGALVLSTDSGSISPLLTKGMAASMNSDCFFVNLDILSYPLIRFFLSISTTNITTN